MTGRFSTIALVAAVAAFTTGPLAVHANMMEHSPPTMAQDGTMMGGDMRDMVTMMAKMAPMMDACAKMMQVSADPSAPASKGSGG